MYEYWIGQGVDYDRIWGDYEKGQSYINKYYSMEVHLIRIGFQHQTSDQPLFNFEAVFKTIKGYFHDLKQYCLSNDEYTTAGPLFIYSVERNSGLWSFLGELRQILLLGTTLSDEKTIGQKLENMDKRIEFLKKHFGNAVRPEDFNRFMKAKSSPELERAIQNLYRQKIKSVEISSEPFKGDVQQIQPSLVDIKRLLDYADEE